MRISNINFFKKTGTIAVLIVFLFSCSNPYDFPVQKGDAEVTFDSELLRSIVSDLDTVPDSYRIQGSSESGETFDITSGNSNVQIPGLNTGTWQVIVHAMNLAGQIIAEGTGSLLVEPGGISQMTVVLYSTAGNGILDFSLVWNDSLVWNESLEIIMKNMNGDIVPVNFTMAAGRASGATQNLPAGFYTLEVQLYDDLVLVMGAMELVQISENGTSSVNLDFSSINKPGRLMTVAQQSFSLAWNNAAPADSYNVYYREHGSYSWVLLGTSPGTSLEFSIDNSILPYGIYDFAVSSVLGTEESELHSCLDDTASPATGWYVDWQGL